LLHLFSAHASEGFKHQLTTENADKLAAPDFWPEPFTHIFFFLASSNWQCAMCNLQLATSNMQHAAGKQKGDPRGEVKQWSMGAGQMRLHNPNPICIWRFRFSFGSGLALFFL